MATAAKKPRFTIEIEVSVNGRVGKAKVTALDADGKIVGNDVGNLSDAAERRKVARNLSKQTGAEKEAIQEAVEAKWNEMLAVARQVREQAAAGSSEAAAVETVQLLDAAPRVIRRPLCLVEGKSYAAAWLQMQRSQKRSVGPAGVVDHDPPLVSVEDVLLVVAGDGSAYADGGAPNARPLRELGAGVRLPTAPRPGRGWSGAGVKRYLAGDRPDPVEAFGRVKGVVDRFLDFARSLADQDAMCELTACYVLSTYLLDAFNVVGYLWPNGERGAAKTKYLQVITELSYLGELILAGSSYACLRDVADYGATLAFDDAEAVMDTRRTDPDKRTLLLAGNRRGATVAVKELQGDRWVTRYVDAFCPRLFSAIRLPDEVLGSRSIIVPLIRSGDPGRTKADCLDPADWPCDRGRLVDDLWALGLAHLPELPGHDRAAAAAARLAGRSLDPWRPILAVAHWLQERHGADGLYERLEDLAVKYQEQERGEFEAADQTRILFRALLALTAGCGADETLKVRPKEVAEEMKKIAGAEDLAEADKAFTTARKVGWLLKRQRFKRPKDRSETGKLWEIKRREVEAACCAYGVDVDGEAAKADAEAVNDVPF